jgi:hypothetical protein
MGTRYSIFGIRRKRYGRIYSQIFSSKHINKFKYFHKWYRVGINNTSPTYTLEVGTTTGSNYVKVNSSPTGEGGIIFGDNDLLAGGMFYHHNSDALYFYTRSGTSYTEKLRIKSNGDVGIGTTTPSSKMHVVTTDSVAGLFTSNLLSYKTKIIKVLYTGTTGSSDPVGVHSEVISNIGFGKGAYLEGGFIGMHAVGKGTTYVGSAYGVFAIADGTAGTRYGLYATTSGSGGTKYAVYAAGNLAYTGGLVNASDANLKQNIVPLPSIIDKIKLLEPKSYSFKNDAQYLAMNLPEGNQYGLTAQDLEKVFPELVVDAVHPGENKDESIHYKGVKMMEMIPILIQAIKEQQAKIEELEKMIQTLKN